MGSLCMIRLELHWSGSVHKIEAGPSRRAFPHGIGERLTVSPFSVKPQHTEIRAPLHNTYAMGYTRF